MRISILLGLAIAGLPVYAQQATARLLGNIFDPSSAAIGGATITVTNLGTAQQRTVQSSAAGEYSIPLLPIGEYTMRVEAPGFPPKSLQGIVLRVDQEARFDVTMTLGSTNETITVQAESPLLVTDSSSVG